MLRIMLRCILAASTFCKTWKPFLRISQNILGKDFNIQGPPFWCCRKIVKVFPYYICGEAFRAFIGIYGDLQKGRDVISTPMVYWDPADALSLQYLDNRMHEWLPVVKYHFFAFIKVTIFWIGYSAAHSRNIA